MPVGRNRRRKRNGKKGRNVVALHVCMFPSSIFFVLWAGKKKINKANGFFMDTKKQNNQKN